MPKENKPKKAPEGEKKLIGKVTHFFGKINVAVIELDSTLNVGDKISIEGPLTNFKQTVDSMQIEHENLDSAGKGQAIGLKVKDRVRVGDLVYLA